MFVKASEGNTVKIQTRREEFLCNAMSREICREAKKCNKLLSRGREEIEHGRKMFEVAKRL
jgi:hypothetical protein